MLVKICLSLKLSPSGMEVSHTILRHASQNFRKKRGIQTQVKLRTKQIVLKNYAKNEDHSL